METRREVDVNKNMEQTREDHVRITVLCYVWIFRIVLFIGVVLSLLHEVKHSEILIESNRDLVTLDMTNKKLHS